MDNHTFKRICYEVLDHDPTHDNIRRFFRRFKAALDGRGLTLADITTDGSPLYPVPITEVFGENAVERGNRRHRKMQKTVYRVRSREHIIQRIAFDMQRDAQAPGRDQATAMLHLARAG